jgi:hypothetical protein
MMGKRGIGMAKGRGRTRAADAADDLWGEALKRWYEQENAALPPPERADLDYDDRPFPPGWWIVPAIVMSLAIWAVIGWMTLT